MMHLKGPKVGPSSEIREVVYVHPPWCISPWPSDQLGIASDSLRMHQAEGEGKSLRVATPVMLQRNLHSSMPDT